MDRSIIPNLKVHYRKFLLRERIATIDEGQEFSINLLRVLSILKRAWKAVKLEIIKKCFNHAGFVIEEQELESSSEDDLDELSRLWSDLEIRCEVEQGVAILDYLS